MTSHDARDTVRELPPFSSRKVRRKLLQRVPGPAGDSLGDNRRSVPNRESALKGAALYVGDGSALSRSLVRRAPNGDLVGHASIALQVRWCEEAGIPHAIFVHFGKECISMGDEELRDALAGLSEKVRVEVAADGQKFVIDGSSKREVLPSELSPDAVTPTWLEGLTDVELRAVHKELHRLWSKL